MRQTSRFLLALLLSGLLSACDTVAYYGQAASGQLSILWQRQDIENLLADPELPDERRESLELVLEARDFARTHMGMEVDGSFRSYVELDRQHALWNVFAAPQLSLEPLTWCYPLAGCVSYRGYFSEARARRYAARLADRGYDVYVGGVDAYSTLGWFNDPLLSTVVERPPHRLFSLVLHELAHQQLYLPGDTTFNESFATFIEQEGLRQWLVGQKESELFLRYQAEERQRAEFVGLVTAYRERFARLYDSGGSEAELLAGKTALQAELRQAHADLVEQWGVPAYQGWFDGPLNNAQLGTVASYNEMVPAFAALWARQAGDWTAFYDAVRELAGLPADERRMALEQLAGEPGRRFTRHVTH